MKFGLGQPDEPNPRTCISLGGVLAGHKGGYTRREVREDSYFTITKTGPKK